MITGLVDTLATKGDLDVFFCIQDNDTNKLKSIPLIGGGWAINDATNTPIAWLSSEDLNKFFSSKQGH